MRFPANFVNGDIKSYKNSNITLCEDDVNEAKIRKELQEHKLNQRKSDCKEKMLYETLIKMHKSGNNCVVWWDLPCGEIPAAVMPELIEDGLIIQDYVMHDEILDEDYISPYHVRLTEKGIKEAKKIYKRKKQINGYKFLSEKD